MPMKRCNKCGREFDGAEQQFCTLECQRAWEADIQERLDAAFKNDKGHTKKLTMPE